MNEGALFLIIFCCVLGPLLIGALAVVHKLLHSIRRAAATARMGDIEAPTSSTPDVVLTASGDAHPAEVELRQAASLASSTALLVPSATANAHSLDPEGRTYIDMSEGTCPHSFFWLKGN
jgi:hypothetical protein